MILAFKYYLVLVLVLFYICKRIQSQSVKEGPQRLNSSHHSPRAHPTISTHLSTFLFVLSLSPSLHILLRCPEDSSCYTDILLSVALASMLLYSDSLHIQGLHLSPAHVVYRTTLIFLAITFLFTVLARLLLLGLMYTLRGR